MSLTATLRKNTAAIAKSMNPVANGLLAGLLSGPRSMNGASINAPNAIPGIINAPIILYGPEANEYFKQLIQEQEIPVRKWQISCISRISHTLKRRRMSDC